jgi:putative ABC transport system substrate-binding protein
MRRRDFLAGLFATAAGAARAAEPDKVYRIALISPSRPVSEMIETDPFYATFFKELHRLGYVEGKNLVVLRFSAENDAARYDPTVRAVVRVPPLT